MSSASLFIRLHEVRLHAFHGLHPEERLWGNTFVVNMEVRLAYTRPITKLHQTLDYAALYTLIQQHMAVPTPLLETLVGTILEEVFVQFPDVLEARLSIRKLNPPLGGQVACSEVELLRSR